MSDQHPDRYGFPIDSTAVRYGRNADQGTYPDDAYIKCKKCGYTMNTNRHPKGWGEGNSQPSTNLNGAVTAGDVTITVGSTTGFPSSGYIYIYDTGVVNSTTGYRMNKVTYTGTTATTFTGCTKVKAHNTAMYVRGERTATGGCPYCGSYDYD